MAILGVIFALALVYTGTMIGLCIYRIKCHPGYTVVQGDNHEAAEDQPLREQDSQA